MWLCRVNFEPTDTTDALAAQPSHKVSGSDLEGVRMLNVFDPCTLQIGDRNYYNVNENDLIMSRSQWKKLQAELLDTNKNNPTVQQTKNISEGEAAASKPDE